ncbi:MAG: glycerophosphodiester phosphodiesterase family protein [Bacteroidota bacterium]
MRFYRSILLLSVAGQLWLSSQAMAQSPSFLTYQDIIAWMDNPTEDHVMVVAHRGDWRNAPENSLQAVQNCIEMGIEIVEIDIRMTKDSQLVVIHDKTLDRTTTGKGKVSNHTLAEIKALNLKNGAGGTTHHRVPTLEEMMLMVKDKPVLLNLDKAWDYPAKTFAVLRKTGTVEQSIFKGNDPYDAVRAEFGPLLDSMIYMPMVWPPDYNIYKKKEDLIKDPAAYTLTYIEALNPLAFEVIYSQEESVIFEVIEEIRKNDIAVWVNALWGRLCAEHHDDMALADPHKHYGWIIEHGAHIIQTDRPAFLISYLEEQGLRARRIK